MLEAGVFLARSDGGRHTGGIARVMQFGSVGARREALRREVKRLLESVARDPAMFSPRVSALLSFIHCNITDPRLTVRTLRVQCGARDNNVSSRFKHEVGCSIRDYCELLRLEIARALLHTTNFTVAEIAASVGYEYLQTFYRAFRRHFGSAPGRGARQREFAASA